MKSEHTDKIFIIEDLREEVAELATQLVTAIGGNVDHFIVYYGNLNKLYYVGQIGLLQQKQDALKRRHKKITTDQEPELLPHLQELLPHSPGTDQKPESLP